MLQRENDSPINRSPLASRFQGSHGVAVSQRFDGKRTFLCSVAREQVTLSGIWDGRCVMLSGDDSRVAKLRRGSQYVAIKLSSPAPSGRQFERWRLEQVVLQAEQSGPIRSR